MFGDRIMLGESTHNLCPKHRFIVPNRTGVEGNEMVIFLSDEENVLKMYLASTIYKKLNEYNERIKNTDNEEEHKFLNNLKNNLLINLSSEMNIDIQKRVVIPKNLLNKYNIDKRIIVIGGDDHLMIFPNEDNLEKYKQKIYQK